MNNAITKKTLHSLSHSTFEVPSTYRSDMLVPARVFTSDSMLEDIMEDRSLEQIVNVSTLPGVQVAALAMPDIHEGYGFPIGGVAATAINEGGVISPGGIGYDINCGVRLLRISMTREEIQPYLEDLATEIFQTVPSGVGRAGPLKVSDKEILNILKDGAHRMLELGYGIESDVIFCEENGRMREADPYLISQKARLRGSDQLGTLGSGNHFLEIQEVEEIYDANISSIFGLQKGNVVVMIHCGSRGLGHQTCTDYVRTMLPKLDEWGIVLPDPELACAPFQSREGQDYYKAMCAAANFAWANRHMITHLVRKACEKIIGHGALVSTVYDISHNIGKKETHLVDGFPKELLVHRKGSTRAFPAGNPEMPEEYQSVGHPVFVPGTMGTSSYVLVGTEEGMQKSFGSCCHGAGRRLSRTKAKKVIQGIELRQELESQGIIIRSDSDIGLAEEAPIAYKDVDSVVRVVEDAQLARRVVRLKPIAVIKGG